MNNDIITVECQNRDPDWTPFGLGEDDVRATDDCSNVTVTFEDRLLEEGECGTSDFISRWICIWTATDDCGNASTFTIFMTIIDTEAPTPDAGYPLELFASCDNVPDPVFPTATDNCSTVTTELSTIREDGPCDGSYTLIRNFTFTDGCGNSSGLTQVVNVQDQTAPDIYLTGHFLVDLVDGGTTQATCQELRDIEDDLVLTIVEDNCDDDPKFDVAWDIGNFVDCGTFGYSYLATVMVTATDDCGNTTTMTVYIEVQDDTPPELVGVPEDVCVDELPEPARVLAVDFCGAPRVTMTESEPMACGTGGVMITRTWTATDRCGNASSASQQIILSNGRSPSLAILDQEGNPVFTGGVLAIEANCAERDLGIRDYVLDNIDFSRVCGLADIKVKVDNIGLGDCSDGGVFATATVAVSATDICGGELSFEASVRILDRTGPVFDELVAIVLNCGSELPTPDVIDLCSAVDTIFGTWIDDPTIVCADESSEYRYEWTAVDECGNASTAIQVVSIRDLWGPIFRNLPDNSCDDDVDPTAVTAFDECVGAEVDVTFTTSSSQLEGCGTLTTWTWTATDACGNASSASRYRQQDDVIPPTLTPIHNRLDETQDGDEITINCPFPRFDEQGFPDFGSRAFEVEDNCPGEPELSVSVTRLTSDACDPEGYLGTYEYIWTATDACGNASTFTLKITLVDNIAPALFNVPHPKVTIFCDDEIPAVEHPTAYDACGSARLDFSTDRQPTDNGFQLTRTWVATDLCGNTETYEQVITYIDKEISCEFELQAERLICGTADNQLTVTNNGGLAPYTYEWRMVDCDGFITDGANEQTVTFTSGFTTQNFEVTVTDADGCKQVCSYSVACIKVIDNPGGTTGPVVVGDPFNFLVFPNPASSNISILIPEATTKAISLELIDIVGKRVLSIKVPELTGVPFDVDISQLPDGPYFLYLNRANGVRSIKQIMVIKP
jgi:hypothetical protein